MNSSLGLYVRALHGHQVQLAEDCRPYHTMRLTSFYNKVYFSLALTSFYRIIRGVEGCCSSSSYAYVAKGWLGVPAMVTSRKHALILYAARRMSLALATMYACSPVFILFRSFSLFFVVTSVRRRRIIFSRSSLYIVGCALIATSCSLSRIRAAAQNYKAYSIMRIEHKVCLLSMLGFSCPFRDTYVGVCAEFTDIVHLGSTAFVVVVDSKRRRTVHTRRQRKDAALYCAFHCSVQ